MKAVHHDADAAERRRRETKDRLLRSAERLFADRGFRDVTVRDICRAARANVAAVNYHFGDKLGLYREVLRFASDRMRETNDAARQAGEGQTPEEQLRRYLTLFLSRMLAAGNDNTVYRLVTREINEPTPALDDLIEQGLKPRVEFVAGLVAAIMGCAPTDRRVIRSVASIQTQLLAYLPNPVWERMGLLPKPTPAHAQEIARHIADFSIAGIRALARQRDPDSAAERSAKKADAVAGR